MIPVIPVTPIQSLSAGPYMLWLKRQPGHSDSAEPKSALLPPPGLSASRVQR